MWKRFVLFVGILMLAAFSLGRADSGVPARLAVEKIRDSHPDSVLAEPPAAESPAVQANFAIPWLSINNGGATAAASPGYRLGFSVGQPVTGLGSSPGYRVGIGFWYGITGLGAPACAVAVTGDVNTNGTITSSDIIVMVNYVFKGGNAPMPCEAAGDVNCDGSITAADIIGLVNYVFKGGAPPCDVCALIPATWSCP